jgi:hypothetical protein
MLKRGDRFGVIDAFAEGAGETPAAGTRTGIGETLPGRNSSSLDDDETIVRSRVAGSR